ANGLEFFGVHGCTDAPTVDIIARDVATLLDNVSYGAVSDYQVVPANTTYILDVALGDAPEVVVASYEASLAAVAGQSAVVYASGFLSPELNPEGSLPFGLYYTLADGTTGAFPVYVMRQAVENTIATAIYPNPAKTNVNITLPAEFNGNIQITDLNGKIVKSVNSTTSTSETLSLNIEGLAAGIYTVTTTSANAINATKLIVE
ncbi:MAG: T9SS type A sorting domain-containing protein, partial [Chitinophagales bacterium]